MSEAATPLARLLSEINWKPETLAQKLNRFAQQQGRPERVHPKTPYKWRTGDRPRKPWPTLVCAVLSEQLQRLVTPHVLGWPSDGIELLPATSGLDQLWTCAGSLQAIKVVAQADAMQRRMFLTAFGSSLVTPALEWLIAHPPGGTSTRAGDNLPEMVVDQIDAMSGALRRMDDQIGGRQTLGLARQHLGVVIDLIDNRRYTTAIGRRLHACAGELLRLAGWLSFDAGQHPQAQRYWIAGLYAAHAAGDRALGANILGFMSCQAKDIGQIREAVSLAETARSGYHNTSSQVACILDLRAAEAYANAGETAAARNAINQAFSRFTDPSSVSPDWAYWISPAHARSQAGYCYLTLKDWSRARYHLSRARTQHHRESPREGALHDVLLATTYARQDSPDLDRACSLGGQALATLSGQVDSPRGVRHLRTLTEDLHPYRHSPAVRRLLTDAGDLVRPASPGAR